MKKFLIIALSFFVTVASFLMADVKTASAKLPLYDGIIQELHGLIIQQAMDYEKRIKLGDYYSMTSKNNNKYYILHFGATKKEETEDGDDYFGFRVNEKNTVDYAYVTIDNVADAPNKDARLHNANLAFTLLCKAMRMSDSDINGLWNQLAVYGSQTKYLFSAPSKVFYQRCTSIHRDIKFTFKPINNNKGIRLRLDVVQP